MDMFSDILLGVATALQPTNLIYCFVGVFLGTAIGVLPGIGALTATSVLLPVTFYLEPTTALVMLAGVFYGAEYGGSTASILLNLPGTASNAITCLDGYPMAKNGRAGVALLTTTLVSFFGGTVGIVMLMALSPAVASLTYAFGPQEYTALMIFALVASSTITPGSALKGIGMVMVGLLLGTVGMEIGSGIPRYTFGQLQLMDGLNLVPIAIGLFGVAEIIFSVNSADRDLPNQKITLRSMIPSRDDLRHTWKPMLRGTAVGGILGPLPGTGQLMASFVAYAVEKKIAKVPSRFGKGAIEGIAAPEAANNAAVQTSFIPTLTMGIPGSATMVIILAAMMIHGIVPGPRLMVNSPDLFWGLAISFWIGNFMLLVLNIPLIGLWVRLLQIPYRLLYPAIIVLVCIGAFAVTNDAFSVFAVLFFGIAGYCFRILGFQPAPLLLGFILGPMLEENFRRSMTLTRGDYSSFFTNPISGVILGLTLAWLVWTAISGLRSLINLRRVGGSAN
jgi:TctA family transporter|tara:strand:- start:16306 stop:17820 length:1515 start_codon:yes stop_codon:yes gene_type:complete